MIGASDEGAGGSVTPLGGDEPRAAGWGWWARARAGATRSLQDVRAFVARRGALSPAPTDGRAPDGRAPDDATRPLPTIAAGHQPAWTSQPADAAIRDGNGPPRDASPTALPNPFLASWADPDRRSWLLGGFLCLFVVAGMILAGPALSRRLVPPASITQPAEQAPEPQPAPPNQAGEAAPPAQPGAEAPPAQQPAPSSRPTAPTAQLALAALPLMLGLFWLLSAWLVDAEARRAFVVQEPWGERRTVAYSCLAVGCVFPLILAGLLFAAYGFVSFVIFVANRQSWITGIQAGAVILLACALGLIVRSMVSRRLADRRTRL